jgi:hypothetical protein
MKKLLVGLIVLVTLLSVPMAVSADSQSYSVSIGGTIQNVFTFSYTNVNPTWNLARDSNNDVVAGSVSLTSNQPWSITMTANALNLANPADTSKGYMYSPTVKDISTSVHSGYLFNPIYFYLQDGETTIATGTVMATGNGLDYSATPYTEDLHARQTIVVGTDVPSTDYGFGATITASQTW